MKEVASKVTTVGSSQITTTGTNPTKETTIQYAIWSISKKKYAGPNFFIEEEKLKCSWTDKIIVDRGLDKKTAFKFMESLRKTYPKSSFTVHRFIISKMECLL